MSAAVLACSTPQVPAEGSDAADRRAAESVLLSLDDLPWGFRVSREVESGESRAGDEEHPWTPELVACLGIEPTRVGRTGPWAQTRFASKNNNPEVLISSEVDVMASAEEAAADLETPRHPRFRSCMSEVSRSGPEDLDGDSVEAEVSLLGYRTVGDDSVALRTTSTIVIDGRTTVAVVDSIMARIGRTMVTVQVGATDEPASGIDVAQLADRMVARASAH
ncbi:MULTISPECIES: hypothetical protein [unclassified Nocardia]|uniref:hypothetical protein n=1 Tax=unclassified Nocardia TaxID=2637762 RepID=UPI00278C6E9E|nr:MULTISPECIES: hypothetical protein [unclassified Nocardia]